MWEASFISYVVVRETPTTWTVVWFSSGVEGRSFPNNQHSRLTPNNKLSLSTHHISMALEPWPWKEPGQGPDISSHLFPIQTWHAQHV